jgi:hypothetical protein
MNPKNRITMEELADHPWVINQVFVGEKKIEKVKVETIKE